MTCLFAAAHVFCRSAARAAIMQQRIAALEEREQQRRYRMESLGKQATTAGGPDINRFMSQLENKNFAAGQDDAKGAAANSTAGSNQQGSNS